MSATLLRATGCVVYRRRAGGAPPCASSYARAATMRKRTVQRTIVCLGRGMPNLRMLNRARNLVLDKLDIKYNESFTVMKLWGEAAVASNPGAIFIVVHKVLA
ncbi:hypothetical protein NFJ02_24g55140 [Pycnococcus provasolii]